MLDRGEKMPRQAREKSKTGIYHVMIRGINHQIIFEDEEDYSKYLQVIKEYKAISKYQILAYCLMGNHIHLIIKEGQEGLERIFKRIGGKYVYWYNGKYSRVGHLFQDRFKSEPVEDDGYLLTVLRYIHQNPIKSGLIKELIDYKWSSFNEYLDTDINGLTDTDTILKMISKDQFIEFHKNANDDKCLDLKNVSLRVTDEQAKRIIYKLSKCSNATEFQLLDLNTRNKLMKKLKEKGLSIRQISRLTGISFGIARKS